VENEPNRGRRSCWSSGITSTHIENGKNEPKCELGRFGSGHAHVTACAPRPELRKRTQLSYRIDVCVLNARSISE
jgi:hypothetical protein